MVRRSELQYLVGGPQLIVGELAEIVVPDIVAVPIRLGRLAIGAVENFSARHDPEVAGLGGIPKNLHQPFKDFLAIALRNGSALAGR